MWKSTYANIVFLIIVIGLLVGAAIHDHFQNQQEAQIKDLRQSEIIQAINESKQTNDAQIQALIERIDKVIEQNAKIISQMEAQK